MIGALLGISELEDPRKRAEQFLRYDRVRLRKQIKHTRSVIVHMDLDCFYVAVERRSNPVLRNKPVGLCQWSQQHASFHNVDFGQDRILNTSGMYTGTAGGGGDGGGTSTTGKGGGKKGNGGGSWAGGGGGHSAGIIALSYEAKAKGVKRGMFVQDALRVCPEMMFVGIPTKFGKADTSCYRDAGSEVMAVLNDYGGVERVSIDEAYVDITARCAEGFEEWVGRRGRELLLEKTLLFDEGLNENANLDARRVGASEEKIAIQSNPKQEAADAKHQPHAHQESATKTAAAHPPDAASREPIDHQHLRPRPVASEASPAADADLKKDTVSPGRPAAAEPPKPDVEERFPSLKRDPEMGTKHDSSSSCAEHSSAPPYRTDSKLQRRRLLELLRQDLQFAFDVFRMKCLPSDDHLTIHGEPYFSDRKFDKAEVKNGGAPGLLLLDAALNSAPPASGTKSSKARLPTEVEAQRQLFQDLFEFYKFVNSARIIHEMQDRVSRQLQLSCSFGVANTKCVSKIASGKHKPFKLSLVYPLGVPDFLNPLPVKDLRGYGQKLGKDICNKLQVGTVGEIFAKKIKFLNEKLTQPVAAALGDACHGIDDNPVCSRLLTKIVGTSKNWRTPQYLIDANLQGWMDTLLADFWEKVAKEKLEHKRRPLQAVVSWKAVDRSDFSKTVDVDKLKSKEFLTRELLFGKDPFLNLGFTAQRWVHIETGEVFRDDSGDADARFVERKCPRLETFFAVPADVSTSSGGGCEGKIKNAKGEVHDEEVIDLDADEDDEVDDGAQKILGTRREPEQAEDKLQEEGDEEGEVMNDRPGAVPVVEPENTMNEFGVAGRRTTAAAHAQAENGEDHAVHDLQIPMIRTQVLLEDEDEEDDMGAAPQPHAQAVRNSFVDDDDEDPFDESPVAARCQGEAMDIFEMVDRSNMNMMGEDEAQPRRKDEADAGEEEEERQGQSSKGPEQEDSLEVDEIQKCDKKTVAVEGGSSPDSMDGTLDTFFEQEIARTNELYYPAANPSSGGERSAVPAPELATINAILRTEEQDLVARRGGQKRSVSRSRQARGQTASQLPGRPKPPKPNSKSRKRGGGADVTGESQLPPIMGVEASTGRAQQASVVRPLEEHQLNSDCSKIASSSVFRFIHEEDAKKAEVVRLEKASQSAAANTGSSGAGPSSKRQKKATSSKKQQPKVSEFFGTATRVGGPSQHLGVSASASSQAVGPRAAPRSINAVGRAGEAQPFASARTQTLRKDMLAKPPDSSIKQKRGLQLHADGTDLAFTNPEDVVELSD